MKPLFRLAPYLRPYFWTLALVVALAVPLAAIANAPVPMIKRVVDDLLIHRDQSKLIFYAWLFIGLYVANFFIRFAHYYLLRVVVVRVNQKIKNDLYQHLMSLSADHFTSSSTGTLISRVGTDPQYIDGGINSLVVMIREPIKFILLFGYALTLNWRLTAVTLMILPPLAWLFAWSGKFLKRYIARITEENARIFSTLQESFTGIRIIQAFRLEKYGRKKFRERNEHFSHLLLKTSAVEEAAHPMVELLTAIAVGGVLYYGGLLVIRGSMTTGDLLSFFGAFGLMMNPIRAINDANIKLHQAVPAAIRIFEVLDWRSRLLEVKHPVRPKTFLDKIEFQDVHFAYPDAPLREILRGVSFDVPRGGAVALVGPSGAGKSSLVNLVPRVFDVTQGKILIDGRDVRDLELDRLRRLIAIVSQDVFLFNDTIEENIRCGRLSATRDEIREAARRANALEFIERAPQGMASIIGDRGQKLSGGEKQRLSIARAFLRQAPILILDEATSSLDNRSERMVQQALEDLMKDRTTIVIAHRLSTVERADQILVLNHGRITERGTHEQLMKREGDYTKLLYAAEMSG